MNLRGLITSLGAGGSLIAAALIAAGLVGGLLAFRGAVDEPAEARGGDVTVPSAGAVAGETSTPEPQAARDVPTAVAGRRAATPRRRAPTRERRSTRPVLPPASDAPRTNTETETAGDGTETGTTGKGAGGGTEEAPPPATRGRLRTVARVVERTRETVVEAAPEPVQPTVDQVVDTVADVADTVDETLAPVTGLLEREL